MRLAAAILLMSVRCWPCTVVYSEPTERAGPNFRVAVSNEGQAMPGLQFELRGLGGSSYRATTDAEGFAAFRNVAPGPYWMFTDHDVGIPGQVGVQVKADGPSGATVGMRWPGAIPLQVRSLRGILRLADHDPAGPQPRLSLELQEGISGRVLKSTVASESGTFDFGDAAPGLYFVHFVSIDDAIPVDVNPEASADDIQLQFGQSSCGLYYKDMTKCSKQDLVFRGSGRVIDVTGRWVPAEVSLLDDAGKPVTNKQADRQGNFDLANVPDGDYDLLVLSPGFTALRRKVRVEPTNNAPPQELIVQLGLMGACSTARVQ